MQLSQGQVHPDVPPRHINGRGSVVVLHDPDASPRHHRAPPSSFGQQRRASLLKSSSSNAASNINGSSKAAAALSSGLPDRDGHAHDQSDHHRRRSSVWSASEATVRRDAAVRRASTTVVVPTKEEILAEREELFMTVKQRADAQRDDKERRASLYRDVRKVKGSTGLLGIEEQPAVPTAMPDFDAATKLNHMSIPFLAQHVAIAQPPTSGPSNVSAHDERRRSTLRPAPSSVIPGSPRRVNVGGKKSIFADPQAFVLGERTDHHNNQQTFKVDASSAGVKPRKESLYVRTVHGERHRREQEQSFRWKSTHAGGGGLSGGLQSSMIRTKKITQELYSFELTDEDKHTLLTALRYVTSKHCFNIEADFRLHIGWPRSVCLDILKVLAETFADWSCVCYQTPARPSNTGSATSGFETQQHQQLSHGASSHTKAVRFPSKFDPATVWNVLHNALTICRKPKGWDGSDIGRAAFFGPEVSIRRIQFLHDALMTDSARQKVAAAEGKLMEPSSPVVVDVGSVSGDGDDVRSGLSTATPFAPWAI